MSEQAGTHKGPDSASQARSGNDDNEESNDPQRKVKRRTKTGCLTCRGRRVKCDEARPICLNCSKGSRVCKYVSRQVVFKDPIEPATVQRNSRAMQSERPHLTGFETGQGRSTVQSTLPTLAPKPPSWDAQQNYPSSSHPLPQHYAASQHQSHAGSSTLPFSYRISPPALVEASPAYSTLPNPLRASTASSQEFIPAQQMNAFRHTAVQSDPWTNNAPQSITPVDQQATANPALEQQTEMLDVEYQDDEDLYAAESDNDLPDAFQDSAMNQVVLDRAWSAIGTATILDSFLENKSLFLFMEHPNQGRLHTNGIRAVVWYFVHITSPSISLYEREPYELTRTNPDKSGTGVGGNDLWCRTIPLMAFQNAGLLQAVLALASLQLANLQRAPPTTAMKHYHLAILRVKDNVSSATKRTRLSTLATLLLLSFFEVWAADHSKWCKHLFGASILLREIPMLRMSRRCLPIKRRRELQNMPASERQLHLGDTSLNYELLQVITGVAVRAEDYGLGDNQPLIDPHLPASEADIKKFENHADLFWWFCKMDVYQSFLGGTKLLMSYEKWLNCPPRTPIAKAKQVYGTYDHVVLLLGRLANFSAKDRVRKSREMAAQASPPTRASPTFPGIVPVGGKVQPPSGFSPTPGVSPQSEAATEEFESSWTLETAIKEWEQIQVAFAHLKTWFTAEFQPLSNEYADRRASPFGTVIQYRSYAVAGVWMNYYMGLIHLYRCHPTMPFAALQAAGKSAKDTQTYANQIGRISCGLIPDTTQLLDANPLVAAALIECAFCLFVAGVQFQDSSQRRWLVNRMHDTTRLTGWTTATQIAEGCESAWIKAAQLGAGAPYTRLFNPGNDRLSIWENPRRLDRMIYGADEAENSDRRIVLSNPDRAHYAYGLLGVEQDMRVLDLDENTDLHN